MATERKNKGSYSVGLATREAILRAATELVSDSGYYGLSLRDVARKVGVSHPAVIYHFPSKEALMRAVVLRYEEAIGIFDVQVDEATGELVRTGFKEDTLAGFLLALMRLAKHPDARTLISLSSLLSVECASPEHPTHNHFIMRTEDLTRFVTKDIERLQEQGLVSAVLEPRFLTSALISAWFGVSILCRYGEDELLTQDAVASFLAESAVILQVSPRTQVAFGSIVPDDLADVYLRSTRIVRSLVTETGFHLMGANPALFTSQAKAAAALAEGTVDMAGNAIPPHARTPTAEDEGH